MRFPHSQSKTGDGAADPRQHQKSDVLENHARRIVDEAARPEKSVPIEHREKHRFDNRTRPGSNAGKYPHPQPHFHDPDCFQQRRAKHGTETRHGLHYPKLRWQLAKDLAPQTFI